MPIDITTNYSAPVYLLKENKSGDYPIHKAVQANNVAFVRWYVERKDSPLDVVNNNGDTAIALSLEHPPELLQTLVCPRADVNKPDHNGLTPLHKAIYHGKKAHVNLLLNEANADPNLATTINQAKQGFSKSRHNCYDITEGSTPIMIATRCDEIFNMFLEYKSPNIFTPPNLEAQNKNNQNVLHCAVSSKALSDATILHLFKTVQAHYPVYQAQTFDRTLTQRQIFNTIDNFGNSILVYAAKRGSLEVFRDLCADGTKLMPKQRDDQYKKAFKAALLAGNDAIVEYMLDSAMVDPTTTVSPYRHRYYSSSSVRTGDGKDETGVISDNDTALLVAIKRGNIKLALKCLSLLTPEQLDQTNSDGEYAALLAVKKLNQPIAMAIAKKQQAIRLMQRPVTNGSLIFGSTTTPPKTSMLHAAAETGFASEQHLRSFFTPEFKENKLQQTLKAKWAEEAKNPIPEHIVSGASKLKIVLQ